MLTSYIRYPAAGGGTGNGIATYATLAALPATAADGTAAVTLDTDTVYIFNLATTTWKAIGSPSTVFGPGAATDLAITIFNGTSGTVIKNSLATISAAGKITAPNLLLSGQTASTVAYFDASKNLVSSAVTPTELGYVSGVTSAIQTQLGTKEATANKGVANGYCDLDSSGLVPITRMPPAAIERLVIVADQTARFALTTATVQNGDTVKQTDTNVMYFVIDQNNLGNSAGYTIYTAGTASSVPWSGITGMPAPVVALLGTNTGDLTLAAVGSAPSANGATLSGQALTLQPADATHPGLITAVAQTIGGAKTFSGAISASNLSGSNTGDQTIGLTGDVSGSGTGSFAATIAANAVTNAKAAQMPANTIKGNNTGSTANASDLTVAQAIALLSPLTTKGDVHGFSSINARLPVGSDYQTAVADANAALGLRYTDLNQGPVNLVRFSDFENGATTGWVLGNIPTLLNGLPLSTSPTFGSGASGNLSLAIDATSAINGVNSLKLASSATNVAGDFVSTAALAIAPRFRTKVLGFNLQFLMSAGTGNFSGSSANSYGIAAFDVTNSAWLGVSGAFNFTQSSGVGTCSGTFQVPSNCASLRFVIYNVTATTGATALLIDDVYVGPQALTYGAAMSDQKSDKTFTPNNFGTLADNSLWYKQIGDWAEVSGTFTSGTSAGSVASISLPFTIDTSKLPAKAAGTNIGDYAATQATSVHLYTGNLAGIMLYDPAVNNQVFFCQITGAVANTFSKDNANQISGGNGSVFSIKFRVPVLGWSSNTVQSADTDTRVVDFSGTKGSTQSVTANVTDITFTSAKDSHGVWTGATYPCPVSGDYTVSAYLTDNASTSQQINVYVNGVFSREFVSLNSGLRGGGSVLVPNCKAGDIISLRSSATTTLAAIGNISILKASGPAVVQATAVIAASYYMSANNAPGAALPFNFDTKILDTHGCVTTGSGWRFTAPAPGIFEITGPMNNVSTAGGVNVWKNGAAYCPAIAYVSAGLAGNMTAMIQLNAGEYFDIRPDTAQTVKGNPLNTTAGGTQPCVIHIKRLGGQG